MMKVKNDFALRQVADTWVVLPVNAAIADFNGMMTLNESGVLLWNALELGADMETLIKKLTGEYIVTQEQAAKDIQEFIEKLKNIGCLEIG